MARTTKLQLEQALAAALAENAAFRTKISELSTQIEALKSAPKASTVVKHNVKPARVPNSQRTALQEAARTMSMKFGVQTRIVDGHIEYKDESGNFVVAH